MEEETITTVDENQNVKIEESTEEETPEESTEESVEEQETTEDSEEEAPPEDEEFTDSVEEFLGDFELPPGVSNLKELAEFAENSYKGTVPEMKRLQGIDQKLLQLEAVLRANGLSVDALLNGKSAPKEPEMPQLPSLVGMINEMKQKGYIQDADIEVNKPFMNAMEAVLQHRDQLYGYTINHLRTEIEGLKNASNSVFSTQKDAEYRELSNFVKRSYQNKVPIPQKEQLDKIMKDYPMITNYRDAFAWMQVKDPNFLAKTVKNASQSAEKKARKDLRFNKGMLRASKGGSPQTTGIKQYINPDGTVNKEKLMSDYPDSMKGGYQKRLEILKKMRGEK